jgi:hypothetical protein
MWKSEWIIISVYQNSFNRLSNIAEISNYRKQWEQNSDQANLFISDVLAQNTVLVPADEEFINVNSISERKTDWQRQPAFLQVELYKKERNREKICLTMIWIL